LDKYDWKLHDIKATRHCIAILFRKVDRLFLGSTKRLKRF
jgi:hypothetical protein